MKEYLDLFLQESANHIKRIEGLLEAGAADAGEGTLNEALFREFHSFKGMAATMSFGAMTKLAHRLEDFLDERRAGAQLGDAEKKFLLKGLDRLSSMRESVSRGGDGEEPWTDLFSPLGGFEQRADKETERAKDSDAPEPGLPLTLTLVMDSTSSVTSLRAFQAVMLFREQDQALTCEPPLEAIQRGGEVQRVRLTLPGMSREQAEILFPRLTEVSELIFEEPPVKTSSAKAAKSDDFKSFMPEAVEVDSATLDGLSESIGDLTLLGARLRQLALTLNSQEVREEARRLDAIIRGLDDRFMKMRCFPFATIAGRFKRMVREEAERLGKKARLVVSGGQMGVDKAVMMRLSGPLLHLLRNSLDHGIESPTERRSVGKPAEGVIELTLERCRNSLRITVADDGRGIDLGAVERIALEKGLLGADEIGRLSMDRVSDLIFSPGFSTRSLVSDLSGRGVGLDAVASEVAALGGGIGLVTEPGKGTSFKLRVPPSHAVTPVLTLSGAGFLLALPVQAINATFELYPEALEADSEGYFTLRGEERLELRCLSDLLGAGQKPAGPRFAVVELSGGARRLGLLVDRLLAEEHLFVKPFQGLWHNLKGLSGYSVTGDGKIIYVLDPYELLGE